MACLADCAHVSLQALQAAAGPSYPKCYVSGKDHGFEDLDKEEVCGILLVSYRRTLAEFTAQMGRDGPHSFNLSSSPEDEEGGSGAEPPKSYT